MLRNLSSKTISVAIKTLGCKLNQYESMGIREELEHSGFRVVSPWEPADVYIINTCTVTGQTDRRSRKAVRHVLKINPEARIIVTGCGAQRDQTMWTDIPHVNAVIGNVEKNSISLYVNRVVEGNAGLVDISDIQQATFARLEISRFGNYSRAFIKIQEGCDRDCSYCVIPSVRGRSRSMDIPGIIDDLTRLVAQNYQEIVLTGIDLGTYGKDLKPQSNLVDLLTQIETIDGLARIRLSSIEPMEFNTDLIKIITGSPRICRHFHIPLQSGSDIVLKRMNRSYTISDYANIINKIKILSPDSCIGADVIVGFPGETDSDFDQAFSFIESLSVDYLHVFPYSDREGTPSSCFTGKIRPDVIKTRSARLRKLSNAKAEKFRTRFIGQTLPVVIIGLNDKKTGLPQGLSDNYIRVLLKGDIPAKGQLTNVQLKTVNGLECIGYVINNKQQV